MSATLPHHSPSAPALHPALAVAVAAAVAGVAAAGGSADQSVGLLGRVFFGAVDILSVVPVEC